MLKGFREKLKWLDPFTYVDLYVMPRVNPENNGTIETIVYIFFAFIFAYILYNFVFAFILGTASPMVIVYSGSMEPVLYRGDIVVLGNASVINVKEETANFPVKDRLLSEYASIIVSPSSKGLRESGIKIGEEEIPFDSKGDIIVYYSELQGLDIIHRAVLKLNASDGDYLITFGDNNTRIDQDCKNSQVPDCINLGAVSVSEVKGRYLFHIPLLGYFKLILFDDLPWAINCISLSQKKPSLGFFECASTFDPVERAILSN